MCPLFTEFARCVNVNVEAQLKSVITQIGIQLPKVMLLKVAEKFPLTEKGFATHQAAITQKFQKGVITDHAQTAKCKCFK
jgi:hypothetical protein